MDGSPPSTDAPLFKLSVKIEWAYLEYLTVVQYTTLRADAIRKWKDGQQLVLVPQRDSGGYLESDLEGPKIAVELVADQKEASAILQLLGSGKFEQADLLGSSEWSGDMDVGQESDSEAGEQDGEASAV